MSRIVFQNGSHQGMSIELERDMVVGRDLNCDIHLVSPDVSRNHCRFSVTPNGTMLEDLGSRNGSYVNGTQIQSILLNHGDVISLGDIVIRFELAANQLAPSFESSIHMDAAFDENQLEMSIAMEGLNYLDLNSGGDLKKKLETFYKVANMVAEQPDESKLFGVILSLLFEIFPQAGRGFILTGNTEDALREEAVFFRNEEDQEGGGQLKISKTVVHMVMVKKEALLCKDAFNDDGFAGSMSIIEENIHSFMCVPLIAMDKIYGLIQIESSEATNPFIKDDLDLLIGVSSLAALFLRSSNLVRTAALEANKRAQLARFFSPQVAENVMNKKLELGGETKYGSVLFCDIVGFTSMSEKVSAAEMVARLNQYFEIMVKIILDERGTVDKFGGDAILSVWGAPEQVQDDPVFAVVAALKMQNAIVAFNHELEKQGALALRMGIGIHSGKFIAGNIGSKDRMEYTIIGDDVNTAKRVESTADGHMLMVSEAAISQNPDLYYGTRFNPIPLKGKSKPLALTCVRGMKRGNGFLLSVPCYINDKFCKITFTKDKKVFNFVSGEDFSDKESANVKLYLPESNELEEFKGVILTPQNDETKYQLVCESASYLSKLLEAGIITEKRDIEWKRGSGH